MRMIQPEEKPDDEVSNEDTPEQEEEDSEEDEDEYSEEMYHQLNAELDRLHSALDGIESQRDVIHGKLSDLLQSSRETREEILGGISGNVAGLQEDVMQIQESISRACLQVESNKTSTEDKEEQDDVPKS